METKEIITIYAPKAKNSIGKIAAYINEKGYPETAEKFTEKLYDFGFTLNIYPDKYPYCKHSQLSKRNMRCAVFHKNYIFVYKLVKNTLVIYNIIHCNTNPAFHFP